MSGASRARTFADHVADYALAGWPCVLPVPAEAKFPPPAGFTGADGRDTAPLDLVGWTATHAGHAIALRMPDGVIGIDVDQYLKGGVQKRGAATLAAALEQWGPLPATWSSTAREADGPSRIHFYRVPPRRYATTLGPDVEIIQRHHRYAVVWPSPHKDAGTYMWYGPDGAPCAPPSPDQLPELPASWVAGLADGATSQGPAAADTASGEALLDQLRADARPECADITSARLTALDKLAAADAGSRHDTMTERVHHLVQLAASGHTGVSYAFTELRLVWDQLTAGEDRGEELERMLLTSARKAVTAVGRAQVPNDPCLLVSGGFPMPATVAAGDDPASEDLTILEPPRWAGPREVIGAHAFDPVAGLDQTLAESVLQRTYPALRYAYDANAWLLRCPDRWELHRRLSPWAVATLAPLMPLGDITADKGSEAYARAQRRSRLMTTAGARAVAGKMDDLVAGGMHPAGVELASLDADPEVLWSGGVPWSLRGSLDGPVPANVDPSTPHLHSAGVVPDARPTPLWDEFLAAVWPDPDVRAWALRVLSIAVTGYADRALPILLGETGRGKTQVVHLLISVLGSYAHAANPKLLGSGAREHDTIVFALKGRRLSFIDEAPSEAKAGQERLKQLTGGGELEARQMNQDPITFRPTHTLVLTANDEPLLTDPAVRARVRILPCDGDPDQVQAARAAIGHVSGPAWRAEAPGVLAALMREAGAWLADRSSAWVSSAPESIRYLAENLGAEQDPVAVWVAEETEPDDTGTPSRELYQAFTASCLRNNLRRDQIPTETRWGRQLTRLGVPSVRTTQGNRRLIRLHHGGSHVPTGPVSLPSATEFVQGSVGFMQGSNPNPTAAKPQVNPSESVNPAGLEGSKPAYAHIRAHDARRGSECQTPPNPTAVREADPPETTSDLQKQGAAGLVRPSTPRKRTAEATQKAAEKREAKRQAAIAEAAGTRVRLPALVTADTVAAIAAHDADQLLASITGQPGAELTVDVETTGYPVGHRHYGLRTIQLGGPMFAVVLDAGDPEHTDLARRHLAAAAVLHAHSATADLVPLAHAGLLDAEEAWTRMHDTVIPAKLADPASTGSDPGLKKLARAVLGAAAVSPDADTARAALFKAGKWLTEVKVTTEPERSGWAQVDPGCTTMVRYAASDVLDDAALARRLPRPPDALLERERTAQRLTARVTHHGLPIDGDQVEHLRSQWLPALEDAGGRLRDFGVDNPGSDQQVGAVAEQLGARLPRTKTGRPSVAQGTLEPWRQAEGQLGDFVRARLDYQKAETALGLFLEPYRQLVVNGDGRARPTVYTLSADTGRMSCVRPNLQQVPREGGFRACITADPGHLLVSADFAGVELRVAAALSQDQNLRAILADSTRDLHWEIARLAFGPQATKSDRYAVKRGVFGRIYGGGVGAIARGVGVSEPTAQSIIDALDAMLPGLTEWSRMVRESVKAGHAAFPTYTGRVAHLPPDFPHKAPNYCIQGTARELLVDALMRWKDTRWGGAVLLPVHDEIVVSVPEDQAADATDALVRCMTSELYGIPIVAEPSDPAFAWEDSA